MGFGKISCFREKTSSESSSGRSDTLTLRWSPREAECRPSRTESFPTATSSNKYYKITESPGLAAILYLLAIWRTTARKRREAPGLAPLQCSDSEVEALTQANATAAAEPEPDIEPNVVPAMLVTRTVFTEATLPGPNMS